MIVFPVSSYMNVEFPMIGAIGFESEEVQLRKLRDRLRLMSEEELIQFGKEWRNLVRARRVSATPDSWPAQLEAAREEWRRRHPKV
jgi:hypothetical protein